MLAPILEAWILNLLILNRPDGLYYKKSISAIEEGRGYAFIDMTSERKQKNALAISSPL
jgi:hypothetical protein